MSFKRLKLGVLQRDVQQQQQQQELLWGLLLLLSVYLFCLSLPLDELAQLFIFKGV